MYTTIKPPDKKYKEGLKLAAIMGDVTRNSRGIVRFSLMGHKADAASLAEQNAYDIGRMKARVESGVPVLDAYNAILAKPANYENAADEIRKASRQQKSDESRLKVIREKTGEVIYADTIDEIWRGLYEKIHGAPPPIVKSKAPKKFSPFAKLKQINREMEAVVNVNGIADPLIIVERWQYGTKSQQDDFINNQNARRKAKATKTPVPPGLKVKLPSIEIPGHVIPAPLSDSPLIFKEKVMPGISEPRGFKVTYGDATKLEDYDVHNLEETFDIIKRKEGVTLEKLAGKLYNKHLTPALNLRVLYQKANDKRKVLMFGNRIGDKDYSLAIVPY